ncbi:MAG: S41 family peptidase, partial [Vicinamibacteria bacterium]|nr:S41 family peptidase [Vicinamibacteria bacterium]
MNTKRIHRISLAVIAISAIAGGWLGKHVLAGSGRLEDHLRLYTAILDTIEQQYVDEVKPDHLVATSIRDMLRTLDPHSNFLEPREHTQLQERQKGSYYGLGITVQSVDGNITVVSTFEGTPAHRLGLRVGDIISKIENEDARGMSINDAVQRLRGPKGSTVRIMITRQGYETPLEFTVIRDEIALHAVPYAFMLTPQTGYIRLQDFNETTACRPIEGKTCEHDLERAIRKLREGGAKSLILDIRDNPGGLLEQSFAVCNALLKRGQLVVFTRGRNKRDESNYITEGESRFADIPLVVLTSKHSASASEIVAGAIQDHDRGLIVGERTFGKGLVQTIMPLRNVRGYALSLTTARYYTPSGRSIQRDYGDTPLEDYYVPSSDRRSCGESLGEPKYTDVGRKVYGGDGIEPDYCAEPVKPSKLVSYLTARGAFVNFALTYEAAEGAGDTKVEGYGTRANTTSKKVRPVSRSFTADDQVMAEFRAFLSERKLRYTDEELKANHDEIAQAIVEEVLRQIYGEGEARKRSAAWDPQMRKALSLVPKAEVLLRDPQRFIALRDAEKRLV